MRTVTFRQQLKRALIEVVCLLIFFLGCVVWLPEAM